MTSLLPRIEGGTGSDRELDALILCKLAAPEGAYVEKSRFNGEWCVYEKDRPGRPPRTWEDPAWGKQLNWHPTSSVDSALSLVERMLPGSFYFLAKGELAPEEPLFAAQIYKSGIGDDDLLGEAEHPSSQCRALLLALLRALESSP